MANLGKGCLGCFGSVVALLIVMAIFGAVFGTNDDGKNETANVAVSDDAGGSQSADDSTEPSKKIKNEEKKEKKSSTECEYDDTILKYKECKITKDDFDNDVLIVYFDFTNNSNENKTYSYVYSTKLFQNGVELEDTYVHAGQETRNAGQEVQPGTTITVADSKKYNGDNSEVTVEVEPWVSFSDEKLMQFKLDF